MTQQMIDFEMGAALLDFLDFVVMRGTFASILQHGNQQGK